MSPHATALPAVTASGLPVLDLALGLAVLAATALSLFGRSRRAQATAFLTLGALMSLLWLRLGSVDVALAEAALGSGLLGALLVRLAAQRPARARADRTPITAVRAVVGVLTGALAVLVVASVLLRAEQRLPAWTDPLAEAMPGTGVTHEVTGVLLSFRAVDTLLETAVLMLAGVAVLTLSPDDAGPASRGPAPALAWLVRVTAPVLVVLGLWLLFAGSSGPGGAFQSGAVLAAVLILLRTAHLPLATPARWAPPALVVGVLVFLAAGALGPLTGDAWLAWDPAWAFAAVLTVEIALTVGIAAGLFLLFLALERDAVGDGAVLTR